jgi:hypothetical protein
MFRYAHHLTVKRLRFRPVLEQNNKTLQLASGGDFKCSFTPHQDNFISMAFCPQVTLFSGIALTTSQCYCINLYIIYFNTMISPRSCSTENLGTKNMLHYVYNVTMVTFVMASIL